MQPGKIGWARWRLIWWPCIIQKFVQTSPSKYQVFVRYYERNGLSASFKLEPIKCELFFRNEEHFNFKVVE